MNETVEIPELKTHPAMVSWVMIKETRIYKGENAISSTNVGKAGKLHENQWN